MKVVDLSPACERQIHPWVDRGRYLGGRTGAGKGVC